MKGSGVVHPLQYHRGSRRMAGRAQQQLVVSVAKDEVDAYYALKAVKNRARRERVELKEHKRRAAITLPKINF